jgi:hypothetical protein
MLLDFFSQPLARLSPKDLEWMKNQQNLIDYLFGVEFSFFRFHGFFEEAFRLPKFIIDKTFSIEAY